MTAQLIGEVEFIQSSLKKITTAAGGRTQAVWKLLKAVGEALEEAGSHILLAKQEFSNSS
jgi:hypothetical protein